MASIKVEVEGHGMIEVTLDFEQLKMSELVTVEKVLGGERYDELTKGIGVERPSVLQAIIYAQLKSQVPEASIDDFDFDLSALADLEEDDPGKEPAAE